ncbi:hypothetical protein [Natronorubrum aibiense]|uniref:DUF4129 domain-containing protein n=1 Tax=Natronorubrum aibiense TaxID=348826 RepID=A0A5P9P2B2_9EURY|nr:hypothetical protein [Natronorubrum aibiense]QFU82264.1 hypothetical protein GCU68_06820 [Natronorubrum aibiense]
MTTAVGRTIVLVVLLVCLPLTAVGGAVAAPADSTNERVAFQQDTPDDGSEDNETVRHQNPDEYDEDGDSEATERWLSDWMSSQLEGSAVELSEGEYDLAREYVDEEYRDRFEQYVDVAGDTESGANNSYEEAQNEQEELTDSVEEYQDLKSQYEASRETGNEERARELARELEVLSNDIESSSQQLQDHYGAISEDEDIDLSDASAAIETVNQDVQTEQEVIRESEFVETELTIEPTNTDISFTEPLVGTGELRTADGEPIANEEIRLDIGNQTIQAETDGAGSFDFEYRPISAPLSAETVTVRYAPETQSVYFGSETDVAVSIEQVEPTITAPVVDPEQVAFGDELVVESELYVDGVPVDGVPLSVSSGGEFLGVTETVNGSFTGSATVPAGISAGEQSVRVALPFEDRALASTEAETTVTVTETEPDLSISASQTDNSEVAVNGTLEAAGNGVGAQSVQLLVDGEVLETVTTDETGAFTGSVSLPEGTTAGDVQLVAVYDDDGTNLARTEAATTVSLSSASNSSAFLPTWMWLVLGLSVVVAGVAGVYWYRDRTESTSPSDSQADESDPVATVDSVESSSLSQALLSQAATQLSRGDADGAVQNGYAAVRTHLESQLEIAGALTHWEFYRQYRERDPASADSVTTLRDVTEGYEQATFGREGISEHDAETVLERARALCGLEETTSTSPADD